MKITSFTKTTSFKLGETLWSMGREIFAEETLEAVERLQIEEIVENSQIKEIVERLQITSEKMHFIFNLTGISSSVANSEFRGSSNKVRHCVHATDFNFHSIRLDNLAL